MTDLTGILEQKDLEEYQYLDQILGNVRDIDGRYGYVMIKLVYRQTELLRKATTSILETRNKGIETFLTHALSVKYGNDENKI